MGGGDLLTGDAAVAAVQDVRRRCREAGEPDPLDEAADLRVRHEGLGAAWVSGDGFALRHAGTLDLAVAPDARRAGLGRRLGEAAAAEPGALSAWAHGDHPGARALAPALGLAPTRELWVMCRPAGVLPQEERADVRIRSYAGEEDVEQLLAVNAAAFEHHPEQGALDRLGLAVRMAEPWFDPADLLLAEAPDGTVLGFHWTKRHDAHHGEVYVVGVSPDAQGRGLGRLLTVAGVNHLTARGVDDIVLYVEAANVAARSLYASLGFTHRPADTHVQYSRTA